MRSIRNIGIIAHIDAGKTTTTERMLFYSGKTHRMGEVDDGSATTDYLDQEKERGITITSAVVSLIWKKANINIIDTPGHVDFTGEVERSLRVLDGAAVIFSAVEGVESQSETVWHQADKYKIPRIVFINKLDRLGADFKSVVDEIKEKFSQHPLVVNIPFGYEDTFTGVADVIERKVYVWNRSTDGLNFEISSPQGKIAEEIEEQRNRLIDYLSDFSEKIAEQFISDGDAENSLIRSEIRKLVIQGNAVPVLCGASRRNIGVQPLLDAIVDYLPSPLDAKEIEVLTLKYSRPKKITLEPNAPFLGLVFKMILDEHVGKVHFIRVYEGTVKTKQPLKNLTNGKNEVIQKIFRIYADKRVERDSATMGDIVGVTGLKSSYTGNTISEDKRDFLLEEPSFPEPIVSVAVEPKTSANLDKLCETLGLFAQEDPTFRFAEDKETGQLIISGMGELYIDILAERLKRDFKIPVKLGNPRVAYRESVGRPNKTVSEVVKTLGGKKFLVRISLEVKPSEDHKNIFVVPKDWKFNDNAVVRKAVEEYAEEFKSYYFPGPIAGFPLMGVECRLYGVEAEDSINETVVLSSLEEVFEKACVAAEPLILEPLMSLEIFIPDDYFGEVIKSLHSLSADISHIEEKKKSKLIHAQVPLAKTFGYASSIRSLTKGKASYTMQFLKYEKLSEYDRNQLLKKICGY
ncbi:elongation factor G [candidate division WOR-3 bacterium]|nr:elongation factor G [candidate division WOR-3 bacterium]